MRDIWSYFLQLEQAVKGGSVLEEITFELAPDEQSGTFRCNANLRADTELDAYVKAFERAVLNEHGQVEVAKYSYYLIVNGAEARAWEKDPTHDPPVHGHIGSDHQRTDAPEVSLREALDLAWDEVQLWAEDELG
jgi:hypothetical protein